MVLLGSGSQIGDGLGTWSLRSGNLRASARASMYLFLYRCRRSTEAVSIFISFAVCSMAGMRINIRPRFRVRADRSSVTTTSGFGSSSHSLVTWLASSTDRLALRDSSSGSVGRLPKARNQCVRCRQRCRAPLPGRHSRCRSTFPNGLPARLGCAGVGQRYIGIAADRFQFSLLAIHDHKRLGTGTDTQAESGRGDIPIYLLTRRGKRQLANG